MIEIEEYRLQLRFPEDFPILQQVDGANIDEAGVRFRPPDIGSLECDRFCSDESATIEPKTRENAELRLLPDRSRPKQPLITSAAPSFRKTGKNAADPRGMSGGLRLLVVDAMKRLFAGRENKPQRSEIEKAGAILELALGRDLDFDLNRCELIGRLIENSKCEADILDRIVAGLKNRGHV